MAQPTHNPTETDPDAIGKLDDACARNAVIEIHRQDNYEAVPAARGRMLLIRDDLLFVAEPQVIGRESRLAPGKEVDAYFSADGVMLHFESEIVSTTETIRLNEEKRVQAYTLTLPTRVIPGQRRSYYRTLVLNQDRIEITLRHVHSVEPIQCAAHEPPFVGSLVDGSPLGFGANIPNTTAWRFALYDAFFLSFQIPEEAHGEFTTLVEIRQSRDIETIGVARLGMMMLPWPNRRDHVRSLQPILRWLKKVDRLSRRAA